MAKRVTEHRVRNWAIGGGISGGAITILLLFAFLSSLGAIEVTDYSGDIICAGTLEDPCEAFINFTAKEDIFIYPSENWSEAILETDKSVKSIKMFRSWGSGWREIKLNEVCTGTWCGASGDAKYAFAFREGKDYTIKYEVLKNSPYDKVKWSFGPVDPLFDSVADIELISESNSLTYGDAVVKITPKTSFVFQGNKVDTWVNKITPSMDLTRYEMEIGQNMSYQEEIWIKDIVCNPWNETTPNETIIEHSGCVDNGYTDYITKYKIEYVPFEKQNFQLTQGEPIYLKVHGEWPAQTGQVIYDWKINLDGYVTTFQWWNNSWYKKRLLSNLTGDIIYIDLNYTDFTGAQADWDGLRFVDNATETIEYGYFLQKKVDSTNVTFRIKTLGATSLYIYYGNSTVSTTSSISDVYGSNIVGAYFLDENSGANAEDFSGNGNNGTAINMEDGDWQGAGIKKGIDFDGVNEIINITHSDFQNINSQITMAAWVYVSDLSKHRKVVDHLGTEYGHAILDDGRTECRIRDSDTYYTANAPAGTITTDRWIHMVCTYNGTYLDSVVNGSSLDTEAHTGDIDTSVDQIGIAASKTDETYIFNGMIDEVFIYDIALNSTEIDWLYNSTEPVYVLGAEEDQDADPVVTLNTPVDTANLTTTSVTFNCTASDDINLANVTLYIDGVLNETNSSGINNTDYIWARTLDSGDYNWTCKGCDNASQCTTPTTRTFNIKLNITGWVTDQNGIFISAARVWIINQTGNVTSGNVATNGTGYWTFGPVIAGTYYITGFDPSNSSLRGDGTPFIVVP